MIHGKEIAFIIILILNFLTALIYLIWTAYIRPKKKDEVTGEMIDRDKIRTRICFWVMILCPVIGPMCFAMAKFFHVWVFRNSPDLEDVIFSKERVKTHDRADEEVERNMVPMEEAIAISDRESLRTLMLNVLKGDIQKSLTAIAMALNSEDTETSHYAASFLRDELNDFRVNVQKVYNQIQEDDENCEEYCCMLLEYMNNVLEQKVFTSMEQKSFVYIMAEVLNTLFEHNYKRITSQYYEWVCLRLLEIGDYRQCEYWCRLAMDDYPQALSSYTCQLKLYFTTQNRRKFFVVLDKLKASQVVIDRETLELIRVFG